MGALPPQLEALLQSHLDSYEKLELLQRLRAARAPSTRDELALPIHAGALDDAIESLVRAGFVDMLDDRIVLGPRAAADSRFEPLMEWYERDKTTVMSELTKIALQRIRDHALRMLDKKDDDEH